MNFELQPEVVWIVYLLVRRSRGCRRSFGCRRRRRRVRLDPLDRQAEEVVAGADAVANFLFKLKINNRQLLFISFSC